MSPFFCCDKMSNRQVSRLGGCHVDEAATLLSGGEHYGAVNEGIKSVVLAHTHVFTGVVNCSTLTFDDVACFSKLTAENLDAESFAF